MYKWQRKTGYAKLVFNLEIPKEDELRRNYKICYGNKKVVLKEKKNNSTFSGLIDCMPDTEIIKQLKSNNVGAIICDYIKQDANTLVVNTYRADVVNTIKELVFCAKDAAEYDIKQNFNRDFLFYTNNGYPSVFVSRKDNKSFMLLGKNKYAIIEIINRCVFCISSVHDVTDMNDNGYTEVYQYYIDTDVDDNVRPKFISYDDACVYNHTNANQINISADDIFKVWRDFTDAIRLTRDNKIRDIGLINYTKSNDIITFKIPNETSDKYDAFIKDVSFEIGMTRGIVPHNMTVESKDDGYTYYSFSDKYVENRSQIPETGVLTITESPEYRRRHRIISKILTKNGVCDIIRSFCNEGFTEQPTVPMGRLITKGLTQEVAKKVYGKNTPDEVDNHEHIDEIIKCAVNTPDICLIQGPAGTGKTTIIKAIITRLKEINKNTKFLICAEQHDAVRNIMDKISGMDTNINYIFSTRYDSALHQSGADKDLEKMLERCDAFMQKQSTNPACHDNVANDIITCIDNQDYASAKRQIGNMRNGMDNDCFQTIMSIIDLLEKDQINFMLDIECDNFLYNYIPDETVSKYSDSELRQWLTNILKNKIEPLCVNDTNTEDLKSIVNKFSIFIQNKSTFSDSMKCYADTMGGTCNQSYKANLDSDTEDALYDYVIIDEAARANPLDIMVPICMGRRVIMVGDHKQLPHYLASEDYQTFANTNNEEADILKHSLFELLFNNIQKATQDGRLQNKRAFMLDTQYRMPAALGTFISDNFYDGLLNNGKNTLGAFNHKNIVCINVPLIRGGEQRENTSLSRDIEVQEISDIVANLIKNRQGNEKIDLGIISFYKGQVEKISEKLQELTQGQNFKDIFTHNIDDMCGTVDSFQGKEFDVVILSCVRSRLGVGNLGFLDTAEGKCRINVALSRAKKQLVVIGDMETLSRIGQNADDSENFPPYFENLRNYISQNPDTCVITTKGQK